MLTHRTNVLLTEEDNQLLTLLATRYNTTKGDIIRRAVRQIYHPQKQAIKKSLHPLEEIHRIIKKHHIKGLSPQEIKEYINYGRKY